MKLLLTLVILFCFSQILWSQSYLSPYHDYENCRTGFINQKNDTVWQAVFDSYVYMNRKNIIVEKSGKFGVIDVHGEVLINFEMDSIYVHPIGRYVALKNGKIGVLSDSSILKPRIVYSEIFELDNFHGESNEYKLYKVRIDDKFGFLDVNFHEQIPVKYDACAYSLNQFYTRGEYHFFDFQCVIYRQNGLLGIIDLYGNELLSPRFSEIYTIQSNVRCASSDHYFKVKNEDGKWALLDKNFDTLVPFYEKLDLPHPNYTDTCNSNSPYVVYAHAPHHSKAYNIKEGTISSRYRRVAPFGSFSLFRDYRGWGVLDENFKEICSKQRYEPSYLSTIGYGIPQNDFVNFVDWSPLYGSQVHPYGEPRLYPSDSVIWTFTSNDKFEFGQPHYPSMTKVGLMHISGMRSIDPVFDQVYLLNKDGDPFYWAVNVLDSMMSISVYNRAFQLVKEFDGVRDDSYYIWDGLPITLHYQDDLSLVQLENREGWKGLFQADGSEVLSFSYDRIEPMEWPGPFNKFIASRNNLVELFNREGNKLLPDHYKSIQRRKYIFWFVKGEEENFLLNRNFERVLDDITFDYHIYDVDKNGKTIPNSSRDKWCVVSEDKLFVYEHSKFVLYDKKRLHTESDAFIFQRKFLMNKKGKVFYASSYEGGVQFSNGYFIFKERNELKYFNGKGKLINSILFRTISYSGDIAQVYLEDSTGILNFNTGEWIIPKGLYSVIVPVKKNGIAIAYWVKKDNSALYYHLIFLDKKYISEVETDTSVDSFWRGLMIIKKGDKYGMINDEGKLLLPFEMNEMREYKLFVMCETGGNWRLISIEWPPHAPTKYHVLDEDFDYFYCQNVDSKHVFAFRSDSMAVLSTSLEEIIPFSPVETILRDSISILDRISKYHGNSLHNQQESRADVYVKNRLFFDNLEFKLISNDSANLLSLACNTRQKSLGHSYRMRFPASRMNGYARKLVSSFNSQFYSIADETYIYQKDRSRLKVAETLSEYGIYRFIEGELIRFDPSNLFANPNEYHAVIDDLLAKDIQKTQRYGDACMELPRMYAELKESTVLTEWGLVFSDSFHHTGTILISWNLLKPYLAEEFKELPFN